MCRQRDSGQKRAMRFLVPISVCLVSAALAGCAGGSSPPTTARAAATTGRAGAASTPRPNPAPPAANPFGSPLTAPHLAKGSDPSVLPGPLLIADRSNDRLLVVDPQGRILWQFPRKGDLRPGQSFPVPDDAFFTPDGKRIIVTEEDVFAVTVIDIATHRIVYRYGKVGVSGSGPNRLWNPDDALMLPNGWIFTPDIKNCRLLLIRPGAHTPARVFGSPAYGCEHDPPRRWGSPNGAFPMRNGNYLVTEINGSWVNELNLAGRVLRSWHPPGVSYPSDSNEVKPGLYVTVGYQSPGVLETFDRRGTLHWRYRPRAGQPQLDHPSLAEPLPNGDFLVTDDYNQRVIVVDPRTNRIVWQYGHTGRAGTAPGYLHQPDGLDLAPPHSLLIRSRATMGLPG